MSLASRFVPICFEAELWSIRARQKDYINNPKAIQKSKESSIG